MDMRKTVAFPPDLEFGYLPQIAFQSEEEKRDILARGLAKLERGEVSGEALLLGEKYRKEIEADYAPHVSVRYVSEQVGYGVFAEEELEGGSFIGEYTGMVRENDRRYFAPLNNYCYEYPVPDSIGRSFVIDATQGNFTRFINHSSRPNLRGIHAFFDGFYHAIFLSLRAIRKGEQLSYDYGANYWYIREKPQEL
jgi:uncharacterized protein